MKIAISASGNSLDAVVDPRFGRCVCFIVIDPDTMQFEALDNAANTSGGGAGIATAQMIAGTGVKTVLTGNCGPNAYQVLSANGIEVITGVSGKVTDAVNSYKTGSYQASPKANVSDHFGFGGGGGGGGRGGGGGGGRGGGGGGGGRGGGRR
jgi:predicted Fe-Mo cluster-binding NifX family protein